MSDRKVNLDDSSVVSTGHDDRVVISGHRSDAGDERLVEHGGSTCRQRDVTGQRTVPRPGLDLRLTTVVVRYRVLN